MGKISTRNEDNYDINVIREMAKYQMMALLEENYRELETYREILSKQGIHISEKTTHHFVELENGDVISLEELDLLNEVKDIQLGFDIRRDFYPDQDILSTVTKLQEDRIVETTINPVENETNSEKSTDEMLEELDNIRATNEEIEQNRGPDVER